MSEKDEFERFITDKFFDIEKDHIGYTSWATAFAWKVWQDTRAAARAPQAVPALTAKQRYDEFMEPGEEPSPIERLRFFCSLAMSGQDWLDVEPFFDDLLAASQPSPEPKGPEHAHDWRFSLQDHVYKCDCGATRGDYPFGAASFKD